MTASFDTNGAQKQSADITKVNGTPQTARDWSGDFLKLQDWTTFEAQHVTLSASTDTTITFASAVRAVQVKNWDVANVVLVKNGAIATDVDASASRVGFAPAANIPNSDWFPIATTTIHIRSAGASICTIEGYR